MKKTIITMAICLLVLSSTTALFAEGQPKGIEGDWKIVSQMGGPGGGGGMRMSNVLSVTKQDDGRLKIVWNMGTQDDDIYNVKFENNKLTFTRTVFFGDFEMDTDIEATLKDGKLTGQMISDRGENDFTGTRILPKPDAVGVWEMTIGTGDRQRTSEVVITVNDKNQLVGKWVSDRGESELSNIKFGDSKLTFDFVRQFGDREFTMSYEGQVKDNQLTGAFTTERGDREANATRKGAAVIGRWDLVTQSEMGEFNSALIIDKDLTATYSMGFGNLDANDLKIEGNKITFNTTFGFGDRSMTLDFDLDIDGNNIKGTSDSDMGTSDITGKKYMPEKTASVAAKDDDDDDDDADDEDEDDDEDDDDEDDDD